MDGGNFEKIEQFRQAASSLCKYSRYNFNLLGPWVVFYAWQTQNKSMKSISCM